MSAEHKNNGRIVSIKTKKKKTKKNAALQSVMSRQVTETGCDVITDRGVVTSESSPESSAEQCGGPPAEGSTR